MLKKLFRDQYIKGNQVKFSAERVGISIIIAAKNEAENIQTNIKSLENLQYHQNYFEVIFIDDHSEDDTSKKITESIQGHQNFKLITLSESDRNGKRSALTKGIKNSRFDNIMITDADCRPEPNWLNACAKKFVSQFDFIFGIAPFRQNNFLTNKIACFENLRSSILTFAFAGSGFPYSAAARNFGFKKNAFETVGGYSKTNQTISGDDDLLLREAVKNKMKIGTITDRDSYVYSDTKKMFKDYLKQKARHTQTSLYYLTKHKLILALWHILNIFSLFSIVLTIFNPLWAILFACKLIMDVIVVGLYEKKFTYRFRLFEIIYLQMIYEFMLVINFISSVFIKKQWK